MAISILNAGPGTVVAQPSDLPYSLVTPGKWEFSDGGNYTIQGPLEDGFWAYYSPELGWSDNFTTEADALAALSLEFEAVTATRPSLSGHLCDRAVNAIAVSTATTLTLPTAVAGKSRDFIVKLSVTGTVSITFSASSGESNPSYVGDAPPASFAEGTYVLRFTEVSVGSFVFNDMTASGGFNLLLSGATTTGDSGIYINGDSSVKYTISYMKNIVRGGSDLGLDTLVFSNVKTVTLITGRENNTKLNGAAMTAGEHALTNDSVIYLDEPDCLAVDTLIRRSDGTDVRIVDLQDGDSILSPFGADIVTRASRGNGNLTDIWTFDDGTVVKTVGRHRFFNSDLGEPMYLEAWKIGEHAVRSDGSKVALVSRKTIAGDVPHATLFTEKYNLYYANGLLAGNRRSARGKEKLS